jgi:demethylmenaquinone methyltransferase / 2-methoxy-6-polyprenyl-1,4-benzoquinol methylase
MSNAKGFGLKEDWCSVQESLREIIPVYDRTNRYISLGSDRKIRRQGLDLLKEVLGDVPELSIVDLGSGTGKMTQLLGRTSVMVDALMPMMQVASERNPNSEGLLAIFENLPFKEGSFQGAMAGFALRDARSLEQALSRISDSIQNGGFFLIVDLSKPDSRLKRGMIALYWWTLAPLIAFFVAGRLGLKFVALSTTYRRLPRNSEFVKLAQDAGFDLVASRFFMLGGASIVLLRKHA